jgi:hypothetical protein
MLTSGDLELTKDLRIRGPGAGILAISSGTKGYIVHVTQTASVTISGLAFKDSIVTNNTASFIENEGTFSLANDTISGNKVYSTESASPTGGGGISNSGNLILENSMVSNNLTTSNKGGGGIYNLDNGSLTLTNSTVSGNVAQNGGGGINFNSYNNDDTLIFCTIYGNKAAKGGGINVETTFFSNGNQTIVSPLQLTNSIAAGNSSAMGPDIAGPVTSGGYNLIQNTSGTTIADPDHKHSTDLSGMPLDKTLIDSILRNNGGKTQTYALLPGSPAIDIIPLNACHINDISTDQRDMKRPDGNENACDIGAFESSS